MKNKFKSICLFLLSFVLGMGMAVPMLFAQGSGTFNVDSYFYQGNQIFRDRSDNATIYTLRSDADSTYGAGLAVENDEGYIELPITAAYAVANGYGVVADGTTTPGLATNDGVPSLVWAYNEYGTGYAVAWTFRIPHDFQDATDLSVQISVSTASATSGSRFNFYMLENKDDTAFDTSGTLHMMSTVATDANSKLDVITADDTGDDPDVDDIYTLVLFLENGKSISGNTELKQVRIKYTRQFNN